VGFNQARRSKKKVDVDYPPKANYTGLELFVEKKGAVDENP
jgi:hypothetical protein